MTFYDKMKHHIKLRYSDLLKKIDLQKKIALLTTKHETSLSQIDTSCGNNVKS